MEEVVDLLTAFMYWTRQGCWKTNARTYSIRYKLVAGNKVVINNYSGGAGTNNSVLSVMEIEP